VEQQENAPVIWIWIGVAALGVPAAILLALHAHVVRRYLPFIERIFQEKPLFILPFGQPVPGAEDVTLTTPDGVRLRGCYLRTEAPRKGVILFGLEFGSNRWACVPYCEFLREQGYDVFALEARGQGDSPAPPGYEPLQWVTEFEVTDLRTALDYLKSRPDRHPLGVGLFGLSKGGSAGLLVAAGDDFVRCCVTDGAFATWTTVMPYVQQWIYIYIRYRAVANALPRWYLHLLARKAIRRVEAKRGCRYPWLERALPRVAPRPLLMIHGGADTYIKPEMARALFARAGEPKTFWLVEGAKHNQAMNAANGEYRRRVLAFFDAHLADATAAAGGPRVVGRRPKTVAHEGAAL
jgi:alpha-beta hydrolase superfamily lysophospholipase